MKNIKRIATISTLLIPLMVVLIILDDSVLYRYFDFDIFYYYGIIICFVISISSWTTLAIRAIRHKYDTGSHSYTIYIVFGAMNLILLLYSLISGFYDMATDTGPFAGLGGAVLVYFVSPVFLILLILDIILYIRKRQKESSLMISTKAKAIACTVSALLAICIYMQINDIISLCCIPVFTLLAIILWIRVLTVHRDN